MTALNKQSLNQEKIEWLNKLADMEYCKSNPGHWLMSLKDTNMLAKLALRSVALLDEMESAENNLIDSECHVAELEDALRDKQALIEAAEKRIAELESRTVNVKLPTTIEPSAFAPWVAKAFYQFHRDTVNSCFAVFSDACATAGIKVEKMK